MSADIAYLDTSAVVKLMVREQESPVLRRELARWPRRASAALLQVELMRAARRTGQPALLAAARRQLRTINLLKLTDSLLDVAAGLPGQSLRSLDAIHIAAAQALGPELGVLVSYDRRMLDAATAAGLPVISPA